MPFDPDAYIAAKKGFDPEAYLAQKGLSVPAEDKPSLLSRAAMGGLHALGTVGEFIDRYTGAPVRAAIGAAQEAKNPLSAYAEQFGSPAENAPTGKQIAEKAGVSTTPLSQVLPGIFSESGKGLPLKKGGILDPSLAGAAGLGIDIAADPVLAAKGIGLLGKAAAKLPMAEEAIGGVKAIAGKGAQIIGKKALHGFAKVGEAMTGVPEQEIKTFVTRFPEVKKLMRNYGAGEDFKTAAADFTTNLNKGIQDARKGWNGKIGEALNGAAGSRKVSPEPILQKLQDSLSRFDATIDSEKIDDVLEQFQKIKGAMNQDGTVTLKTLNRIRKDLNEQARGGRIRGGQIFPRGDDVKQIFAQVSDQASSVMKGFDPKIDEAFGKLSELHRFEDRPALQRLLKPEGESLGSISTAGGATNPMTRAALRDVDKAIGGKFLEQSENLAAARRFSHLPLKPIESTGKSLLAPMAMSAAGGAVGGLPGAAVGAALASPYALRGIIEASRVPRALGKIASKIPISAIESLRLAGMPQYAGIGLLSENQNNEGVLGTLLRQRQMGLLSQENR